MWPFSVIKKNRARKNYAMKISPALHRLYGKQKTYSPQQIRTAARHEKLDLDYICMAYSLHLDRISFDKLHREMGEVCDYVAMKARMIQELNRLETKGWFEFDSDFDIGDFDFWD